MSAGPRLRWDTGTGYDLVVSLYVLHHPASFGLRASWAAGVRSRIASPGREALAAAARHLGAPVAWMSALDLGDHEGAKDAERILDHMDGVANDLLLWELARTETSHELGEVLESVRHRGAWNADDLDRARQAMRRHVASSSSERNLEGWLDCWARAEEFGAAYKRGLRDYYEAFFREEERRLRPGLQAGLERGRELSQRLSVLDLLEELTAGLRLEDLALKESLTLVPSFWISPLMLYSSLPGDAGLVCFGSRPADAAIIPGEVVPDRLSTGLSALADHTRLRILRLLVARPHSQVELARALRLRAPTITHHLKSLRMAGLVRAVYNTSSDRRYEIRVTAISQLWRHLESFIAGDEGHN